MYAGHLGAALGFWSFRRTIPLWLILVASQLPDWFDAGLCLASLDRGPFGLYSHGWTVIVGAAVLVAAGYAVIARDVTGGLILALTIGSHYALDLLTGHKPTWAGGPIIGLDLYSKPLIDLVLEMLTIWIGWRLYRRTLPPESRDRWSVYAILLGLLALQLAAGIAFYLKLTGGTKC